MMPAYAINQDPREYDCEIDAPADDFADLDNLLAGAVKAAEQRKALKSKGKAKIILTPEQIEALIEEQERNRWDDQYAIARFIETHCECGHSHQRFDGWFIVSQHRRDPSARRFRRHEGHEGLDAWRYVAVEEVETCAECLDLSQLPICTPDWLPGIDCLGQAGDTDCVQMELELDDELDAMTDLLAELEEETE